MIDVTKLSYESGKDLEFLQEALNQTSDDLSKEIGLSKAAYYELLNGNIVPSNTLEKVYSYIYEKGFCLNSVKEDLLKESTKDFVLFHGSRTGLKIISETGSRVNCDFSNGFYLSEKYEHAISFVCEAKHPSVYSFTCNMENLNILRFDCSMDWMLAICYFRGTINEYKNASMIQSIIKKVNDADVIIAPIANNRMFYIMTLFANGEINADVALHSLSASKLGLQYVFKTQKGLDKLVPREKYYLCLKERIDCKQAMIRRTNEIETKLKFCKREYKNGLYIEELLI